MTTTYAAMRDAIGASRDEIADRTGLSARTLGRIEHGERPLYRFEVHRLASGLYDAMRARQATR